MTETPLWSADVSRHGSVSTVTLSGELDLVAAGHLRLLLVEQLDQPGTTGVTADLKAVTFVDSAALGAFISAYQHAAAVNRRFFLAEPARPVRRVLEISGVYEMLVAVDENVTPPG
ncbi:STAS domain-containing protein [Actinoplanes sp. NPDC048796]|uniref:STAS domain-containing protein n=1 Tax=unclassified Actinoplanes TaxID=2626549 RepID=UPI0033FCACED